MAMKKMAFPAEDDDDLDVEALRLAALQTLKKTAAPSAITPSSSVNTLHVSNGPRLQLKGGPRLHQIRGRGRGHILNMNPRRGRGRGGFPNSFNTPQNFFPSRTSGNSNLITIVPTVPDESCSLSDGQQQSSKSPVKVSSNATADSTLNEEEKVPAKFRRLDDDSDSDESDDETDLKVASDLESSGDDDDDDDKVDDKSRGKSDSESEKDDDLMSLQPEDMEGDNSLERLMQELEDEISEAPKTLDTKKTAACSKAPSNAEKIQKVKKSKKEKRKIETSPAEPALGDDTSKAASSSYKLGDLTNQSTDFKNALSPQNKESRSRSLSPHPTLRTQSRSPHSYQPVPRHSPEECRSPRATSPTSINGPPKSFNPQRLHSPTRSPLRRRTRSPRRSRTPVEIRSPRRSRSPRKSRSPRRNHYHASSRSPVRRSGSRSPYRSPRRSPHYLPPRASSPSRLPPLRSRSRSPGRVGYARRSRSPLRRSPTTVRRQSPYRRSRSRSPGGRLYLPRRSRSFSPRVPLGSRRSPSPRSRRSPVYSKKLSPKRRSLTPKRRSISPRRSPSPRRRSGSPRRRSVSPRRRPASPGWSRSSPLRNRSPMGSYRQASPRRRSPYIVRRSPSPVSRKHSPLPVHRGISPPRTYRSPSPSSRNIRRRSPITSSGPHRRSPPHHRPPSPSYNISPSKQIRISRSPGCVREKQKRLSPLPPVARSNPRPLSPRRQRSPVLHVRGHHSLKTASPVRKVSPVLTLKKSPSPLKETMVTGRAGSPFDSISLSPSPERLPPIKGLEDRGRSRKSHPLAESHTDSKRSRTELRNVLPRRKEMLMDVESIGTSRSEELSKRERKEKKRLKRERERLKREVQQDSSNVLEARRRKFQSSMPVEVSGKRIRLRNMTSEQVELEEEDMYTRDPEVNIEKEKERELKEVNEVDESILDRELMGGVDLLWSDEEEAAEEEEEEETSTTNNVQFKRTFNLPTVSNNSGKENIPEDSNDSKKDDDEGNDAEQPSSTVGSPLTIQNGNDDSEEENCGAASECSEDIGNAKDDKEPQDAWPKTNRELKEYILSQAKGGSALVRNPKPSSKEASSKSKANELNIDLRAELSRRRAERLTKVCPEVLPGRLLQSALQGVGVKSRREKSHRRRVRSPPAFEDDQDQQESDGRRVLVLRRAAEKREPAINITISKVESSIESSSVKMSKKLPIHLRLGTGKKTEEGLQKVKLKRNITVGRKKQV